MCYLNCLLFTGFSTFIFLTKIRNEQCLLLTTDFVVFTDKQSKIAFSNNSSCILFIAIFIEWLFTNKYLYMDILWRQVHQFIIPHLPSQQRLLIFSLVLQKIFNILCSSRYHLARFYWLIEKYASQSQFNVNIHASNIWSRNCKVPPVTRVLCLVLQIENIDKSEPSIQCCDNQLTNQSAVLGRQQCYTCRLRI